MKHARKSLARARSRLLMAAALGGAVALATGTADAVQSPRPMPRKTTKKKTTKKKTTKKKTTKKKTTKKKTTKKKTTKRDPRASKPDPRRPPRGKRLPQKKRVPWKRRKPLPRAPGKGTPSFEKDVEAKSDCGYSKRYLAVAPAGDRLAQTANGQGSNDPTEPKAMNFATYQLSGAGVIFEETRTHSTIVAKNQNAGFYNYAFSPSGNALWALYPVAAASKFYNITRINTADWTDTPFSHFGQLEQQYPPVIAVAQSDAGDRGLVRSYGFMEDRLQVLNPDDHEARDYWSFSTKPDGYPGYDLMKIVQVLVEGNLVYVVGWARISTSLTNAENDPRATVLVADINSRAVVQGPFVVPDLRSQLSGPTLDSIGPSSGLVARLSNDKQSIYIASPDFRHRFTAGGASGFTLENGIARIELASGQAVVGTPFKTYPGEEDLHSQKTLDVFERGGKTWIVLETRPSNNGPRSRKLVQLDSSLNRTSTEKTFPVSWVADWEVHPGNTSELVLSLTSGADKCRILMWPP